MALHKTRGSDRLTRPNPVIPFPTKNLALRGSLFSLFQPVSIMDQELKAMPLSYWTKLHIRSLHPVQLEPGRRQPPRPSTSSIPRHPTRVKISCLSTVTRLTPRLPPRFGSSDPCLTYPPPDPILRAGPSSRQTTPFPYSSAPSPLCRTICGVRRPSLSIKPSLPALL